MEDKQLVIKFAVALMLEKSEKARNNDTYLMAEVLKMMGMPTDLSVLCDIETAPVLATITRCRRKLQSCYPDLRATERVRRKRNEAQTDFKEIAKDVPYLGGRDEA